MSNYCIAFSLYDYNLEYMDLLIRSLTKVTRIFIADINPQTVCTGSSSFLFLVKTEPHCRDIPWIIIRQKPLVISL